MAYQRILTIQDISCVGQCSLTVALPILSACGHETAALPPAVLSTHTGRFQVYSAAICAACAAGHPRSSAPVKAEANTSPVP